MINARRDEYKIAVRNNLTIPLLAQYVEGTGHTIDFENTKMIAVTEKVTTQPNTPQYLIIREDKKSLSSTWKTT